MTRPREQDAAQHAAWSFASQAAALFAVDPRLGGVALHASAGPVRDAWMDLLRSLAPAKAPFRRAPLSIGDERLLGGLDLPATLRAGRPVAQTGLMAEAHGGFLVMAMAERLTTATAARIASALDSGEVSAEREGLSLRAPARFGVVALDEGQGDDERPPAALLDRLAFHLDLNEIGHNCAREHFATAEDVADARQRLASVRVDDQAIEALVTVAARLGVGSLRAISLALRAACAACALRGAQALEEEDIMSAARFVLAPRATMFPTSEPAPEEDQPEDSESKPEDDEQDRQTPETPPDNTEPQDKQDLPDLTDLVLAAALAAIPPGLLAQLQAGRAMRVKSERGGKSGANAPAGKRGRPIGARQGQLREGRLGLVDTLRAAAPWQRMRRKGLEDEAARRVVVHAEDFRIKRFKQRRETSAIFVVDASGSSAMQRLAEVKGAIELLLVDCYARRDSVALVAFRGKTAEVVLPPTRSLARAKRVLAGLPGGGGTPIAAGIETALALADTVRRKGQTPLVVLMTDGRANVGRTGVPGRAAAFEDAMQAGRQVRAAGIATLAIDTAPALGPAGTAPTAKLGEAMNARYIRLPYANAALVSQAVRAAAPTP
jgi:magnesium chelatase subunit D